MEIDFIFSCWISGLGRDLARHHVLPHIIAVNINFKC
jgi:hypothetical protein